MAKSKQIVKVDGHDLAISNVDKIYFPETGFTKGEVIAFYSEIADIIVPHLRDRPLTMKRSPEGVEGETFYEKNAPKHTPAWVETFAVPRSEGGAGDQLHSLQRSARRSFGRPTWETSKSMSCSRRRRISMNRRRSFSISILERLPASSSAEKWRCI